MAVAQVINIAAAVRRISASHLLNDLLYVRWNVKLCPLTHSLSAKVLAAEVTLRYYLLAAPAMMTKAVLFFCSVCPCVYCMSVCLCWRMAKAEKLLIRN